MLESKPNWQEKQTCPVIEMVAHTHAHEWISLVIVNLTPVSIACLSKIDFSFDEYRHNGGSCICGSLCSPYYYKTNEDN